MSAHLRTLLEASGASDRITLTPAYEELSEAAEALWSAICDRIGGGFDVTPITAALIRYDIMMALIETRHGAAKGAIADLEKAMAERSAA